MWNPRLDSFGKQSNIVSWNATITACARANEKDDKTVFGRLGSVASSLLYWLYTCFCFGIHIHISPRHQWHNSCAPSLGVLYMVPTFRCKWGLRQAAETKHWCAIRTQWSFFSKELLVQQSGRAMASSVCRKLCKPVLFGSKAYS